LRVYTNRDFPQGTVEKGEMLFDAAKRETAEAAGLTDLNFRWASIYFHALAHSYRRAE
jgi:8-oxo-dGTP pyrophosphatase MutT (NUDIX family)